MRSRSAPWGLPCPSSWGSVGADGHHPLLEGPHQEWKGTLEGAAAQFNPTSILSTYCVPHTTLSWGGRATRDDSSSPPTSHRACHPETGALMSHLSCQEGPWAWAPSMPWPAPGRTGLGSTEEALLASVLEWKWDTGWHGPH